MCQPAQQQPTTVIIMTPAPAAATAAAASTAVVPRRPSCMSSNQNKRPLRLRPSSVVTFAPMVTVTETQRVSPDEIGLVWYTHHDLMSFKTEARNIAADSQLRHDDNSDSSDDSDDDQTTATTPATLRGLEACSYARQWHRQMSIKCTVSAYRRGMTTQQTANVSMTCSSWVARQAFVVACHDYAEVYQPHLVATIPPKELTPPEFPFGFIKTTKSANTRKRGVSTEIVEPAVERNVRQRVW